MADSKEKDTHSLILENGWKQGIVLTSSKLSELGITGCDVCDYWVVVTQTCDIAHDAIESEPNIELLGGSIVSENNGNLVNLKNPRKIQQTHQNNNKKQFIVFNIANRLLIDRNICIKKKVPEDHYNLSISQLDEIIVLLLNRYRRPAFPDEFERRLKVKAVSLDIKKALKGNVIALEGIYFDLKPETELSENEEYILKVTGLIDSYSYGEGDVKDSNDAFDKFVKAIKKAQGIKVVHYAVYDPNTFTVLMERELKRYNYDYYSYRQE